MRRPCRVCGAGYRRSTIARIAAARATSAAAIIGYSEPGNIDRPHPVLACWNGNSEARPAIRSGRTGQARGLRARPRIAHNSPLGARPWFARSVVSWRHFPMVNMAAIKPGVSASAPSRGGSASAAPIPAAMRTRASKARMVSPSTGTTRARPPVRRADRLWGPDAVRALQTTRR